MWNGFGIDPEVRHYRRSRSSQQRLLEMALKLAHRAIRLGEGGLQVLDGLEKWVAVETLRRSLAGAQANANDSSGRVGRFSRDWHGAVCIVAQAG